MTKQIKDRFRNIIQHSEFMVKVSSPGHGGFGVSDLEYSLNAERVSSDFLSLGTLTQDLSKIANWTKTSIETNLHSVGLKGAEVIAFESDLEDGSGHHKRILSREKFDHFIRYILFFPQHSTFSKEGLINVLIAQTHDVKTGKRLIRYRPYFFELDRKGIANDGGRCISCHPNGAREIVPRTLYGLDHEDKDRIRLWNDQIRDLGKPDWQGAFNESAVGPEMGGSCRLCHGRDQARAPITMFTHPGLIRSKIASLQMPLATPYLSYVSDFVFGGKKDRAVRIENAVAGEDYVSMDMATKAALEQRGFSGLSSIMLLPFLTEDDLSESVASHLKNRSEFLFQDLEKRTLQWLRGGTE